MAGGTLGRRARSWDCGFALSRVARNGRARQRSASPFLQKRNVAREMHVANCRTRWLIRGHAQLGGALWQCRSRLVWPRMIRDLLSPITVRFKYFDESLDAVLFLRGRVKVAGRVPRMLGWSPAGGYQRADRVDGWAVGLKVWGPRRLRAPCVDKFVAQPVV